MKIPRFYQNLIKYLQTNKVLVIYGPRRVGKTTMLSDFLNSCADLVLQTVCDVYEKNCEMAIIVTSDGDYAGLVKFLQRKGVLKAVLSPAPPEKCSILLKRTSAVISYLNDQKSILEIQKEKAPDEDETS